jgi:hypothetical protein
MKTTYERLSQCPQLLKVTRNTNTVCRKHTQHFPLNKLLSNFLDMAHATILPRRRDQILLHSENEAG